MAMSDIDAAAEALRALGGTDGGGHLAGQLSRLIVVIAHEAVRTKRFRNELLDALVPAPDGAGASETGSGSASRRELEKLTKDQLKALIDREGMDPKATIKSRTTKGVMIDLVLSFQETKDAQTPDAVAPAEAAPDPTATETVVEKDASSTQVDATAADRTTTSAAEVAPVTESTAVDQPPANPPKRRRQPSPIDPYAIAARDGVEGLRGELQRLDIEQLKDTIAEYGMNYDGRAMGWKDHHRFVERVIEKTDFGTMQGNAFRSER